MKPHLLFPLAAGLALASAGCVTTQQAMDPPPASQADVQYLREELRRLSARLDATEGEVGRMASEIRSSRSGQPATASASQVQAMQAQIDDQQRQIRALDAARGQDKKQIYDDISKKVASLLKTAPPPSSRSASQSGYEHVVQAGESLSAIAAAYKATISAIVKANNLKSADTIFVGQTLFIPD
ncbi:MAG: LysM peptidoglycan-binding domain-containing protein [Kiritimatiellae bacterium]|jgi:LysM repeat protein|nr:LysM peptidoglycan-binding domain-containing protein [Kiritimatiellia bacterium]MDY0150234.1 LysM peptidoglycan-binding domain-containing protein [Kiritimatiellia bacterium]